MKNKDILIFSAHYDDETLGMGGTIYRLVHGMGCRVSLCVCTDSSSTQYRGDEVIKEKKVLECQQAMKVLGVVNILHGNLPDMQLDQVKHHILNNAMAKAIKDVRPDIVFCPSPHELNNDHRLIAESLRVAIRPVGEFPSEVYYYEILSSSEWNLDSVFKPNVFYDITSCIDKKIAALACYQTETRKYPHPRSAEGVRILGGYRGLQAGVQYAEAFRLYREVVR